MKFRLYMDWIYSSNGHKRLNLAFNYQVEEKISIVNIHLFTKKTDWRNEDDELDE